MSKPNVIIAIFGAVSVAINTCLFLSYAHQHTGLSRSHDELLIAPQNIRSNRADGCYHVLIDVGANIGVHTRFLFEPEKYPESKVAVRHFAALFGATRDNRDFCSFGFEPNPAHKGRHLKLQSAYKRVNWRYHPIFAGVSDEDGDMLFYHMGKRDESQMEFGFNSLRKRNQYGEDGRAETVPIIRLATFLQQIRDRRLPKVVFGDYADGPKVVMKLDTERMEWVILPDLITSGMLCQTVDFAFGEFHAQQFFFPIDKPGLHLANAEEGRAFGEALIKVIHSSQHCKTKYSVGDDESYLKDREIFQLKDRQIEGDEIPFPQPPNR